jgi:hypothetical protein
MSFQIKNSTTVNLLLSVFSKHKHNPIKIMELHKIYIVIIYRKFNTFYKVHYSFSHFNSLFVMQPSAIMANIMLSFQVAYHHRKQDLYSVTICYPEIRSGAIPISIREAASLKLTSTLFRQR